MYTERSNIFVYTILSLLDFIGKIMYTKLNFSFFIVYMFFLITFVFCFTSITKNNFDILG